MKVLWASIVLCCMSSSSIYSANGDAISLDDALKNAIKGRTDDKTVQVAWTLLATRSKEHLRREALSLERFYLNVRRDVNISRDCDSSMLRVLQAAKDSKSWAVTMLDSWGRLPSGVLEGTLTSLGSYDECHTVGETLDTEVTPAYCTLKFRPLLPPRPRFHNILRQISSLVEAVKGNSTSNENVMSLLAEKAQFFYYTPLRLGLCLPSNCSVEDIDQLAHQVGRSFAVQGHAVSCETREEALQFSSTRTSDTYEKIALTAVSVMLVAAALGTLVDFVSDSTESSKLDSGHNYSLLKSCLLAFSVMRNGRSLLSVRRSVDRSAAELSCLNGIRFWTMAWIILGHTAVWIHYEAFSRSYNIVDMLTPFHAQAFFNTTLSVETFFFISGLLTSYITWSATSGGRREQFNTKLYLLSRYLRLTPGLVFSILFVFLLPRLGSGPLWRETVKPIVQGCRDNWWVNLIYLHNYVNTDKICLLPSWWLANDMHFHVLSLAVILAWMRRPYLGHFVTAIVVVGFTVIAAVDSYVHDYPPTILSTLPQVEEVWTDLVLKHFYRPYLHAGPFFGGLSLGYVLAKRHFPKLSKTQVGAGWVTCLVTLFLVAKGPYHWTIGVEYSRLSAAIFCATNRLLWTLAIAWVIWACSAGYGGVVNRFLSWTPFAPLARMTYMVYLTHMLLVWTYMGTRRQLSDATIYTGLYMFLGHLLLAYVLGFFCTILFESPFLVLQKTFIARSQRYSAALQTNNNVKRVAVPLNPKLLRKADNDQDNDQDNEEEEADQEQLDEERQRDSVKLTAFQAA